MEKKSFQFVQTSELSGECYQIISDTNRMKVKTDSCKTSEVSYHWLSSSSGWGGKCYEIDANDGPSAFINKAKHEMCRPSKVRYSVRTSEFNQAGDCYEVDSENGRQAYSYKVRRENCFTAKESEKKYAWKQVGPYKGECLESQVSSDNKVTIKKSNYENCVDFKVREKFIKLDPVSGVCVLVDDETSGKLFVHQISMSKCRSQIKEFDYQFITLSDGNVRCYEIDRKTQGESYIKKTLIDECQDLKITPKWFADEDDPWSGKCLGVNEKGEVHSKKSLNPLKCRPEKVKVLWHNYERFNGFCFEVDGEKGPEYYAKKIDISKCKPTFTKFIFYRKKNEKSGNCFDADSKTGGELYHKRVGAKSCKRELPQIKKD
ncbi:hypothetical protein [Halobacteriovorax sp. HLS]|uniref:hypothetical protein n=1 Tax=Halobacteriovorax sp. HLS TaxID=2234000 RepID=UPI000FDA8A9D|nr:hypothetical protein [Halobacteriovorax sp. HLS]